jgi:hypothetical protein
MKEITGYLIDRSTGFGIGTKPVSFLKLDGTAVPATGTGLTTGAKDAITGGDGKFSAWWELSPGPVNVLVDASGIDSEFKVRKHNEKAQLGWQWSSDISRLARHFPAGVARGFLSELEIDVVPGTLNILIKTGAAVFGGGVTSIESGNMTIAGTANINPAVNPRFDLVTLRRYSETAAGQLSGAEFVWVTPGTTTSVVPSVPAGADFVDMPLGYISIANGAGTYTRPADWDRRPFTTAAPPKTVRGTTYAIGVQTPLTTTYMKWADAVLTGLNPAQIYDGYLRFMTDFPTSLSQGQLYWILLDTATGPGLLNVGDLNIFNTIGHDTTDFSWPIVGFTGSTTLTIPIRFKNAQAGQNFYLVNRGWWMIELRPRI